MQHVVYEFENEEIMREVIEKLWNQHGVTGEMSVRPSTGGRWRMEMMSEKDVRESTLEKYASYRVEAGD